MQDNYSKPHDLRLENRKKLSLTGVTEVPGFNEEAVSLTTTLGSLFVRGSGLHISKLDLDSGEVDIEGVISALQYTESKGGKTFVQRLFK